MDYVKPNMLASYVATDLYAAASGFQSSPGDDSASHCGNDTSLGVYDSNCS
jgi:hypothetical protein